MKIVEWLLMGDPVIERLTRIYLLNQQVDYIETGYLGRYLSLYKIDKAGWGYGLYSPKWISDHYTLLELMDMEINPYHPYFQQSTKHLIQKFWFQGRGRQGKGRHFDVCIAAMFLSLASYGKINIPQTQEIVDYLLSSIMPDGGWNCSYDALPKKSHKSSLHTTLSVLEAFSRYQEAKYTYRIQEVLNSVPQAEEFILSKHLFRSVTTGEVIHPRMTIMHYPPRWYYDAPRALLYFQNAHYPYDVRMQETLDYLKLELQKGYVTKDKGYANLKHFALEKGRMGRFNTLRALMILRKYQPDFYNYIMKQDFDYVLNKDKAI